MPAPNDACVRPAAKCVFWAGHLERERAPLQGSIGLTR
jgi:hypothetical protein